MLVDADETLLHQAALPFSQAATTDHRFYDRLIFGGWDEARGIGFLAGLGVYKNMGTTDGFLVVQRDGRQHNLRLAEPWDGRRAPGTVGPLDIRILAPYERFAIQTGPNPSGLACDLIWSTSSGVHLEPPHRANGAGGSWDYVRYNQCGAIEGWIQIDGETVEARNWWAFRDHSWGARPGVGGFEPARAAPNGASARALLLSLFYRTADYSCHMIRIEGPNGDLLYQHGTLIPQGERFAPVAELREWSHDIQFAGAHGYRSFRYRTRWSDGRTIEIEGRPVLAPWIFRGAGYDGGFDDGRGLGAQRRTVVEHDITELAAPDPVDGRPAQMHFEQPASLVVDGMALPGYAPVIVYPKPQPR